MEDVERIKSKLDELKATIRRRQSVAYSIEWMTDRLDEFSSFYKTFEEAAKTMGYVSPRTLRERKRRQMKQVENLLARAIRLAILCRKSRGPQDKGSP